MKRPEIGKCRLKNGIWWFYQKRKLLGSWKKGFHISRKYKYKIVNEDHCSFNGQTIAVIAIGKYCIVV